MRAHFDELMVAGVESMMVSPGYTYDKAPDQKHFLGKARSKKLFRSILSNRKKTWRVQCVAHLHGVPDGQAGLTCTPWGMPTFSIFGWQKPCYLLQDGYADTFQELMETVQWANYGDRRAAIRSARTAWCTPGYEAQRCELHVRFAEGLSTDREGDLLSQYEDEGAMKLLNEWKPASHGPLVQIAAPVSSNGASELQEVSGD